MPIDVTVARSPGWWMKRMFDQLNDQRRKRRLQLLWDYHRGDAPLPEGAESAREAYRGFQKKARTNFGELIVSALSERMSISGFRSAVDDDVTGDAEIGSMWRRSALNVVSSDVHDLMFALSEAYVIVGAVDEETGAPLVTCEDPRFMIGESEPGNPHRIVAALKILHDDAAAEDRAYLFLPGEVWVATHARGVYQSPDMVYHRSPVGPVLNFDPRTWEWDAERSGKLPHSRMPVIKFQNKYALGEFESHLDVLDRINHQTLQRMTIAVMQAFRQRAIKGLPLVYPDDHEQAGEEVNYAEVFTSDPAALWQLPDGAEMWESQQVDLRPILEAVKDDLTQLASVTRTPLHMLMPGGDNQSAEGATAQREGLVFKVKDRIDRTSFPWCQVISLMLIHAGQPERADLAKLEPIWAPAEHLSLSEKGDAASKAANDMPRRTRLIKIWGMTPAEADQAMSEWEDEQLALQLAAQAAAAAQATTEANAQLKIIDRQERVRAEQQARQPAAQPGRQPVAAGADVS